MTKTLTLTLFFLLLTTTTSSISPSPSPSPQTPSQPTGLASGGKPVQSSARSNTNRAHRPPPGHHHSRMPPPPPPTPARRELNLGQKVGVVFASIAVGMQVVFVGILVFARWQLRRLDLKAAAATSSTSPLS